MAGNEKITARGGDGRAVREQAHDGLCHELDDDRDEHAEAERDGDGIPQRLQRAAGLARADALRAEGLTPVQLPMLVSVSPASVSAFL